MSFADPCPCGSGSALPACCGALHTGARQAETPEQLMRSRFSAFARGDVDYLARTWHPRTRPAMSSIDPETRWTRLEIIDARDDEVEFIAHYVDASGPGALHERSRFARRAGRWFYLDGDTR